MESFSVYQFYSEGKIVYELIQKKFYNKRYSSFKRALHKLQNMIIFFYDTQLIRTMFKILNVDTVKGILEVGCGQGTDALLISRYAHEVVAIDVSSNALKVATKLSHINSSSEKTSFIVGDAQYLPLRDGLFDVVFCKDLLHHVSNSLSTLLEMERVAKKGGKVVAIEANACNPQMILIGLIYYSVDKGVFKNTKTRLTAMFRKAGLSDAGVEETEYFPRHALFEYRSPLCGVSVFRSRLFLRTLRIMEKNMQNLSIMKKFANYLIVHGVKN